MGYNMCSKLASTIFDQFVSIVNTLNTSDTCTINPCGFTYQLVHHNNYTTLNISYRYLDDCDRVYDVTVVVDITNICFDDLSCPKWVNYLETLARQLLDNVCPKVCTIIYPESSCRKQPPVWEPFPCRETRYITQEEVIVCPEEPTLVHTKVCKCSKPCKKNVVKTARQMIIISKPIYP